MATEYGPMNISKSKTIISETVSQQEKRHAKEARHAAYKGSKTAV